MILVELTLKSTGDQIVVNMDHVRYFIADGSESNGTTIVLEGRQIDVTESFDKVLALAEEMECARARRIKQGMDE